MRIASNGAATDAIAGAVFAVLFGALMAAFAAFDSMRPPFLVIAAIAVAAGAAFALAIRRFRRSALVRAQTSIALAEGETVIADGPANHFLNAEGRGGWLYLTDRRLRFQPHRINLQTMPLDIPLADITGAEPSLLIGFVPMGLTVRTRSGTERFSVHGRRQWAEVIRGRIGKT